MEARVNDRDDRLVVGHVEGVTLTRWRRAWAEQHPTVTLDVVDVALADQRSVLDAGRVDLCFVRTPLPTDGLALVSLYEEVPVVVVPRDHPVSLYETVTLADLSEETLLDGDPQALAGDPYDLVAGGAGVLIVPHAVARARSRRDLVARPVTDAEPTRVALAWPRDDEHPATQDFVGVVRGRTARSSRGATPDPPPSPAAGQPRPDRARPTRSSTGRRATARRPERRRGQR